MTNANKPNVYESVTAKIVAAIEAGAGKWQMPWHCNLDSGGALSVPFNVVTKRAYRGMNIMLLWGASDARVWGTYKQWQSLGAQVRKGERSTACVKWNTVEYTDPKDPTAKPTRRMFPYGFSVFSVDQVDGYEYEPPKVEDQTKMLKEADKAIAKLKADIKHGGNRAFYQPSLDYIGMPPRKAFKGSKTSDATESYYSTLLHELTHWTGHPSRLKRDLSGRFGNDAYAFEELVAEIGAAFACAKLGITNTPRPDHAQYVAHWLRVMKGDTRAIFSAASMAQKACDWIAPPGDSLVEMKEAA